MANWLHHGVVTEAQVKETSERMAGNFGTSAAYMAAFELVLKGPAQPSGHTESQLHAWQLKVKAAA